MDFFTHFIMGILLSVYTLQSMPFSLLPYAAAMSVIADFDIFIEPLNIIKKSNFLLHKTLTFLFHCVCCIIFHSINFYLFNQ